MSRPGTLNLTVMVLARNDARLISACVNSCAKVAETVLVVDTGSHDETRDVAARHGATVLRMRWRDDFSSIRNAALQHVRTDWVLVLDADERLRPAALEQLARLLTTVPAGCGGIKALIKTYGDGQSLAFTGWRPETVNGKRRYWYPDVQVRLFRRRRSIRYEGAVFETVDRSIHDAGLSILPPSFVIHHFPERRSASSQRARLQRYMTLCNANIRAGASPAMSRLHRALIRDALGQPLDAVLKDVRAALTIAPTLVPAHFCFGRFLEGAGDLAGARTAYTKALALYPRHSAAAEGLRRLPGGDSR